MKTQEYAERQWSDAIDFFGSKSAMARELEVTNQLVYGWGGKIPIKWALYLHWATDHEIRFDPDLEAEDLFDF